MIVYYPTQEWYVEADENFQLDVWLDVRIRVPASEVGFLRLLVGRLLVLFDRTLVFVLVATMQALPPCHAEPNVGTTIIFGPSIVS